MKLHYHIVFIALFAAATLALTSGCEYPVYPSGWPPSGGDGTTPGISGITPANEALPGVNTITIHGSNFIGITDTNGVYFDNAPAEILQKTATDIIVRRPNLISASCTVKVVSDSSITVAKYGPYRIDAVQGTFGTFVANVALSTITTDNSGNLYVTESGTRYLWKITPGGQTTQILDTSQNPIQLKQVPTDARVISDSLFYFVTGRFPYFVRRVNLNLGVQVDSFAVSKNIQCCDVDANDYLYAGGPKSGIIVIRPNRSIRADGYYANDTILSVRVFSGYLYVALRTGIWRHSLSDTSLVGAQEQVLDWTSTAYASLPIRSFSFSSDGSKLYIGTNSTYPIIIANVTSLPIPASEVDILYKGILPTYCKQFGFGDAIYMISGNASPAVTWNVYRVDVGTTGAPYY